MGYSVTIQYLQRKHTDQIRETGIHNYNFWILRAFKILSTRYFERQVIVNHGCPAVSCHISNHCWELHPRMLTTFSPAHLPPHLSQTLVTVLLLTTPRRSDFYLPYLSGSMSFLCLIHFIQHNIHLMARWYCIAYECHVFFIHSPMNGHPGRAHNLVAVNSAAVHLSPRQIDFFFLLERYPVLGLSDHTAVLFYGGTPCFQ